MSAADGGPGRSLTLDGAFALESGERLPSVTVAYRTWGRLVARFRREIEAGRGREEGTWVA